MSGIAVSTGMNWGVAAKILAAVLRDGTPKGQREALVELGKMAAAADLAVEFDRILRSVLPHAQHEAAAGACLGCDPGNEGADIWGELASQIEAALARRPL